MNPFGPNLFTFGWNFINSDNFEGQGSKVLKYPSDYVIQPPGKSVLCSIEIIHAKREIGIKWHAEQRSILGGSKLIEQTFFNSLGPCMINGRAGKDSWIDLATCGDASTVIMSYIA